MSAPAVAQKEDEKQRKHKPLKFTYKEQQEFEQIDAQIAAREQELGQMNEEIEKGGSDFELVASLVAEQRKLEEHLELLLERWTYLHELAEQIANQ